MLLVRNLIRVNESHRVVDCLIKVNTLRQEAPFTVSPYEP